ncbi:hypothetical protein Zm00014a_040295 [Zea mays]|uniref:Uncharacterized protein n=1 Tax=Zea mays TaxID=4577 RepID=A0A3L6DC86_MAIZE|nr:hypothetical protein Zm00014a_040295 [Zea mays]
MDNACGSAPSTLPRPHLRHSRGRRADYDQDQAAYSMRSSAAVFNFPVEHIQESLRALGLSVDAGGSPVLALKRRHCIHRRLPKNKMEANKEEQTKAQPARAGHIKTGPYVETFSTEYALLDQS